MPSISGSFPDGPYGTGWNPDKRGGQEGWVREVDGGAGSWLGLGAGAGVANAAHDQFLPSPSLPLSERLIYRCLLKGLSKVMFSSTVAFSSQGF